MRAFVFGIVLALAALSAGAQAGSHVGDRPPVMADRSVEQRWADQLRPGAQTGVRRPPVQLAFHDTRPQRGYAQPQRQGLLQLLFGQRPAAQPRRSYRQPARVAPRAVPRVQQRRPTVAAAPRPAPAARTPQQRTIAPQFLPTIVDYDGAHEPGTVVIDTGEKFLYLVQEDGKARRYGVGVGREGFGWKGTVAVGRKAEWPSWTPPKEMIGRQPWLAKYSKGMPGGPDNPLGARALYLYEGERDTLFRIHGSNEPWTIGQNVSSGCIRMRNDDVTELYNRVPIGATVVVL
jgi:lipoprotein-anchoring transpeptidase ErfK/SrfK